MYSFLLPELLGYTIPMYNLMIAIGILFMLLYVAWRFEKIDGFTRKETNKILFYIGGSLIAALLVSWLSDGIFHTLHEGELAFGSITFLGGLVGGLVCFVLLIKVADKELKKKIPVILNTVIVGVVLAHAFGRIGCTMAGCCYGIPTDSFLGVSFPYGESGGVPVYPTQLYESIFLFALFFALNKVQLFNGKEFSVYLVGYGVWRFLVEFIRGDDRGEFFTFIQGTYSNFPTPAQYISVLMIAVGVWLLINYKKNKSRG